ncbi:hypothetical protein FJY71_04705, partial [candidate division WOR-3 bacterium]|nr:hypothetical protein [candidate division WOR-3 bacterium]
MQTQSLLLLLLTAAGLARISNVQADSRGLRFRYEPGAAVLSDAGGGRAGVSFDDAGHLAQPGEWDLPCKVVRVGVSQRGAVRLSVSPGPVTEAGDVRLASVPFFSWEGDSSWFDDPPASAAASGLVELGPVEQFRSVRFVTLTIRPADYDPVRMRLRCHEWIDVSLDFDEPALVAGRPDPGDGWIAGALLNGGLARDWKLDEPRRLSGGFPESPAWLKLKVNRTGIYHLTGADLRSAGVPIAGVDPRTLALYTAGEHQPNVSYPDSLTPVPLRVLDEDDGELDRSDTLIFYGLAPEHWLGFCSTYVRNYFTDDNVYWLTWGSGPGRRMGHGLGPDSAGLPTVSTGRDVVRHEQDVDCPARSGLLWIWSRLLKLADRPAASLETELRLERPVRLLRVRGRFFSESADNRLSLHVNGRPVADFQFNQALPSSPFDFAVDTALPLADNGNALRFDLSGSGQKTVYLDYFDVTCTRRLSLADGQLHFLSDDTGACRFALTGAASSPVVLEVTDPYDPLMTDEPAHAGDSASFTHRRGRPAEFAVTCRSRLLRPQVAGMRSPGRLRDPTVQADYWVISPGEFAPAAQELARFRANNVAGIDHAQARAVALDDLYDDYCFGLAEPWAVKAFLADKRPAYALLVGDATYDYRGRLGATRPPGVPAYESGFGLDPDGARDRSALAVDAWYADFEGEGASPDVALGRVTARSGAELRRF